MSTIKRITVFIFAALILAANLPLCASAVDPVSAATMANAMAQAVTAYGASQGVSMTFDVTDTDGIGEGVHELWDQFIEDVSDPNTPTYDSLAVTMWSNLYSKIGNNLGINISASVMPYIDSFWNWLLSGPAEMTKVDNEYFEWTVNQGGTVSPIIVLTSGPFDNQPIPVSTTQQWPEITNFYLIQITSNGNDYVLDGVYSYANGRSIYVCTIGNDYGLLLISQSSDAVGMIVSVWASTNRGHNIQSSLSSSSGNLYYSYAYNYKYPNATCPHYASVNDALNGVQDYFDNPSNYIDSSICVQPYIGDVAPQDVYIPDTTDVNYQPVDVAIPLDIPWDNTLFGDGSGTLTNAQSEAAVDAADSAITDSFEKTLTIIDTATPPAPEPGEVYIPFLPVTLPSFNFNFSGIWHYVVEWIASLGAWFTMVLTVWANLPYAITVPVYASLVILIVLGVYRRFLS